MEGLGGSGSKPRAQIAPYIRSQRLRRHPLAALRLLSTFSGIVLTVPRLVDVERPRSQKQLMMAPDARAGLFFQTSGSSKN